VGHLRDNGLEVTVTEVADLAAIKAEHHITQDLMSCHTAVIGDYVIEGHVPADAILRFLEEEPDWAGLSVPGMPQGSPGMEGPNPVAYDVLAFDRNGNSTVYESR
jgi:hypothetical protein